MDNFGIYKLISSLTGGANSNDDGKIPLNKDGLGSIEQIVKTVIPYFLSPENKNNLDKKEQPKTKNKTDATNEIIRRHDEFVKKVYQTHGKNFKE